MELIKGTCFFCANSKVVSDYESVHSTIITLFSGKIKEDKLINLTPPKVCPLCYHSFVLMKRTHDDILHSSSAEKVHENCHLCGNSEDVINVSKWTHFKDIGKDFPCSNTDVISNVCSDCLYYLETKSTVKEKLIAEYPVLKQESIISQFEVFAHSTPTRRTRTKAERKSPVDIIDLVGHVPTEIMKFRPLKNDKHLRRSKDVNTDPKLLNQVLIIKLPNSLEEPVKPRKSSTPKRVRFQDVDEHIIDRYNSPSLFTDKENTYKDTEELVEYEIKTTPRKSRYRDVDDIESNIDSLDPRKKSFFKIKLMKKKPKSIIVKPNRDAPKYPVERHKIAIEKRREAFDKRRTASHKPNNLEDLVKRVCKYNLVVNLDRMILPETNGVSQTDSSLDELDPLRIDSWEDTNTTVANVHNNKQSKTKTKTNFSRKRPRRRAIAEDNVKKETNGYIESKNPKLKRNQTKKEENTRNTRTRNRTSIVSVSSEDDFKPKEIKPKPKPSSRKRRATICADDSIIIQDNAKAGVNGTGEKESDVEILAEEIKKPLRKRRSAINRKNVKTAAKIKSTKGINESEEKGSGVEIRAADSSVTEHTEKMETESEENKGQEDSTGPDNDVIAIDAEEKVADENSEKCEKTVETSEIVEDENEVLNKEDENVQNDDVTNEIVDNDVLTEKINEVRSAAEEDDRVDPENLDKVENVENEKENTCEESKTESSDEEAAIRREVSDTDQKADNEISDEGDQQTQNEKEVIDHGENKSDNEISDKEDSKMSDENEVLEEDEGEESKKSEIESDQVQENENSEQELDQTGDTNPDKVEDIEDKTEDDEVTTADEDTTANEANTADEETTADDANAADEETTADEEIAGDDVKSVHEETAPDNDETAADEVNGADEEIADDVNTADEETTADEDNTANDSTQAEENTETEEIDSQDVSVEQNGEATEDDLSQEIEENDCTEAADEDQDAADEEEEPNDETTDNGETLDKTKDEEEFDDVCNNIEATLASFEGLTDVNEESEIVNLDTTIESQESEVTGEKRKRRDSEDSLSNESGSDTKRKKVTPCEKFDLGQDV